jgi:hypothetical protein
LSHRSRLLHDRATIQAASPLNFPNMQQRPLLPPPPQNIGLDQLVPMLISQNAERGVRLEHNAEALLIRIIMHCGPIVIPFDLTPTQAREFAAGLDAQAELIAPEPLDDDDPVVIAPDGEALLAEFLEAALVQHPDTP